MGIHIRLGSDKKKNPSNNTHRGFLSSLILGVLEKVIVYGVLIAIAIGLLYYFNPTFYYTLFGGLF